MSISGKNGDEISLSKSSFISRPLVIIAKMVNWKDLTAKISDPELHFQHHVTSTKLYNAKRHCNQLKEIVPTQRATDFERIESRKHELVLELSISLSIKKLQFYDELEIVFYNLRSCIDSFLWEINLIFKLGCSKAAQVRDAMNIKYTEKEITKLLNNLQKECWFKYLRETRNNLTHRLLPAVAIAADLKLYLPSMRVTNKSSLFSYGLEKEYELFPCLDRLVENTQDFLEKGYNILLDEFPVRLVS